MLLSKRGKRRLLALAVVACALAAGLILLRAARQAQQTRLMTQARAAGVEAYRRGDLEVALRELSYYFEHRKKDLEANMMFADVRSRLPSVGGRHLLEAIDLYDAHGLDLITELGGHEVERRQVLLELLGLYAQLGDRSEVEATADALLQIDPSMVQALAAKGEVAFLSRRFHDAELTATRLAEIEPNNLAWRKMIIEARSRTGATSDMLVEQCRTWAAESPDDARFRLLTAATLVDAGRTDEARAELRSVADIGIGSQTVLEQIVALMDMLDLRDEADAVLSTARDTFPDEWWPREVTVRRLWHDGRIEESLSEVARAEADLGEMTVALRRLQVAALLSAGRRHEALASLEQILSGSEGSQREHDGNMAWARAVVAAIEGGWAKWPVVMTSLQTALGAAPRDAVLLTLLGDVNAAVGETGSAVQAYEQAYAAAPAWWGAGVTLGRTLLEIGRLDEAYQVARTVATRSGLDRVEPFLLLTEVFVALREAGIPVSSLPGGDMTGDLLPALEDLCAQHRDDPRAASLLVRLHLAAGNPRAAEEACRNIMADPHVPPEVLLALADINETTMLELREPLLGRASQIAGTSIELAWRQAVMMAEAGKVQEGLLLIDQAIETIASTDAALETAECARVEYLLRVNHKDASSELANLVARHQNSVPVQRFVLTQPAAWTDQPLIAQAMQNLRGILGKGASQVRLAEANFLIQHHHRDPEMLAKAIASINSVLAESPDSLAALSLAADALLRGDSASLPAAQEHLERATALYPSEPSLVVRLIAILQRQGRFDDARRHLQSLAHMLRAHPEYAREELRLLQAQGDFESALVRAAAIVNDSSPLPDQLLLAAMEERAGRHENAEEIYLRLLEANENENLVLAQAAEFYAATGRFRRGLDYLQQLSAQMEPGERDLLIGTFHQRHGRTAEAREWLRAAVDANPQFAAARNELARHYLAAGEIELARDQALEGLRRHPDDPSLRSTLAIANLALPAADHRQAIALLRELGKGNDGLLAMLELLERVPRSQGRLMPTADNLADARRLTEDHAFFLPGWQFAVSLHLQAGRHNDAISLARTAVGRLLGQPEPSVWATDLLIQASQWDDALAEALEWKRRTLSDPMEAECAIARILLALGQHDAARAAVLPHETRIIDERAAYPGRVEVLITSLVSAGDIERASQLIEPLLPEDLRWLRLWIATATIMPTHEADAALQAMEAMAMTADDQLAIASQWLALAQRTSSEAHLERATTLATAMANDQPAGVAGRAVILGAVAEARGDMSAAEREYRRALDAAPGHAVALNNLACVLTAVGRPAEALPLIEQARAIDSRNADFLDTHANALVGLDRPKEAEVLIDRALTMRPSDPAFWLTRAEVDLALGDPARAAKSLDRMGRLAEHLSARLRERSRNLRERIDKSENNQADGRAEPIVP